MISTGCERPATVSDKRAVAPSDKKWSCSHDASPSARAARRFFAPSATCFMVRLAYRGSTLADLCRPCARISASVRSESAASVNPSCRNEVKVRSSRNPAARITSLTLWPVSRGTMISTPLPTTDSRGEACQGYVVLRRSRPVDSPARLRRSSRLKDLVGKAAATPSVRPVSRSHNAPPTSGICQSNASPAAAGPSWKA